MRKSQGLLYIVLAVGMIFVFSALAFAQGGEPVQLADNSKINQKILVGPNGMTLYQFTNDTAGKSNCSGNCLVNWPALTVTQGTTPTAASGVTGKLGTIVRTDDGQSQVTINDMPLYYFKNDKAVGDANGQGVGDVWYVVDATGNMIKTTAAETATVTATPTTAATPTAEATATTAPASAAAVTTTTTATVTRAAPSSLPTTGGSGSGTSLVLLLAGLLTLAFGAGLGLNAAKSDRSHVVL